jgi:hypothetical protein
MCPFCDLPPDLEEKEKNKSISDDEIIQLFLLRLHALSAKNQKQFFKDKKDNLKQFECLIISDFKQNILLPLRRNYTGRNFYKNLQATVLTFLVYYRDGEQNLCSRTFTYTSHILNHDAHIASECFKRVIKNILQSICKKLKRVFLFSDNGQPFRSAQYFYSVFHSFPSVKFSMHFFAEYHGKCEVDGFFGRLSSILKRARAG